MNNSIMWLVIQNVFLMILIGFAVYIAIRDYNSDTGSKPEKDDTK